jgi:hypothetical protein
MGSVRDCNDDARCESFFATEDTEPLERHHFQSQERA